MVIGSPTVLNLIPGGVMKMVHVNQTDKNMDIRFQIMNGNQPFNVPEGWTGTIRGTKGDAFGYAAAVTVTAGSNLVTAHLKEQLTAVAGVGNVFELVFASTSAKVSTENFILAVEKSALNDETVISESDLVYANQVLNQLQSVAAVNQQVQQNKTNIATETATRAAADTTLQNNINAEAAARQAADQTLQSNINAEASTRATADASLQSQIDQLVAPSGEAPSAAEVLNARIGADGVTYPTLGDAIRTNDSELKSHINDIAGYAYVVFASKAYGTDILPVGFSQTLGYLRGMQLSNPGNLAGTTATSNHTFWVQASSSMDVYVEMSTGSVMSIGLFNGSPYGEANRVSPIYASNDNTYPLPTSENPLHVIAGQYVTFSYFNGATDITNMSWTLYNVSKRDLKKTLPLTETMNAQVDAKITDAEKVMVNGYYHLPGTWARHAWDRAGTEIDNRDYRVRYVDTLTFDSDRYLVAAQGFYIAGYASTDGFATATFLDASTVKMALAGVAYRIYMRRITENYEEVADIDTFANALTVSTALAPIELYKPTFADVSMFERMGVCGDSYAAGGGIISGIRSLTWGKNLERQAGIIVDIYARSGQTVVQWVQDATNGLPAVLAGEECGLYWLQHGINGTATPEDLGTAADMSASPRPATFYGQYTEAVEQIKATFPKARIILATIIGSSFSLYQTQYANVNVAIRAIAEYCQVMLVDVADDDFYKSPYYGLWSRSNHPTAMQCGGIAMANRRLISKCIQDNGDYFVNYGVQS